jgi:DNA polymerase III epsilon subunit-like protein
VAPSGLQLVFFDLECAGLNPQWHPLIQIAAIAVDESLNPLESFEVKVRFHRQRAEQNALRKNHYHPGVWAREARSPREAARSFADFLRRHAAIPMIDAKGRVFYVAQLVAHNAGFDGPFLSAWYKRQRIYLPASKHVLCTLQRAMWLFREVKGRPPKNFQLATLCHHFGVPYHAAEAHEALADVRATIAVYGALTQQRRVQAQPAASAPALPSGQTPC